MLLHDLHVPIPTISTIWCDNVGVIALASNPIFHARIKYIEVDYHFIWEKVFNNDISIKYVPTLTQIVDVFTKGLPTRFLLLRDKLIVSSHPMRLRGDASQQIDEAMIDAISGCITGCITWGNRLCWQSLLTIGH